MMKKQLLLGLLALPMLAQAQQPGFYVGGQYQDVDVDGDVSLSAIVLQGGYQFNEHFAAELRYAFGAGDDNVGDVKIELSNYYGAYLRAQLPTASGFVPYALLGYSSAELEASFAGNSAKEDETDLSYGVGVEYDFGNQFSIGLEYLILIDKDGGDVTNIGIGGRYRF